MNIVCVAGGNYKSFYLNYFLKIKKCDLLIFNYDIIYDYDIKEEILGSAIVSKELKYLSKSLKCIVVAGIKLKELEKNAIIVCENDELYITNLKLGAKVIINKKTFVIGNIYTNYRHYNKIILSKNRIYPNINNCSKNKKYIFCDKFGVSFVENKKIIRKFQKYSKIILK